MFAFLSSASSTFALINLEYFIAALKYHEAQQKQSSPEQYDYEEQNDYVEDDEDAEFDRTSYEHAKSRKWKGARNKKLFLIEKSERSYGNYAEFSYGEEGVHQGEPVCSDQEFRCPYLEETKCFHYDKLCDGVDDCGDGSDEVDLENSTYIYTKDFANHLKKTSNFQIFMIELVNENNGFWTQ
ncbi:unnamed protein product [Strongylus vulgaris]|uniref:Uncharacterized protein n=1 Tax=Strongylus vulgaris TaxID=40348 RepID=A0A3P7J4B9_STRVU|nr:unnamed protein product [Strongylus vulgaris]